MTSAVRLETDRLAGGVVVRFAHPPTRNALDRGTRADLVGRLDEWDADPDVRVIVVTGLDPAFTSGVDARQLLSADYEPLSRNPADALRAMQTPTIAAVNGACVSGGLEIALGCSFIIASERARFADTHARLGLVPGWGLSAALPAAVGVARARQLTLTGEAIDAPTALAWGLINEVVPHAGLMRRCAELAAAVAGADPEVLAAGLRLYRQEQEAALADARRRERDLLQRWHVDREAAGGRFADGAPTAAQSVSPPST